MTIPLLSVDCSDYGKLSTHEMIQCTDRELQQYDRKLNRVYRELMQRLPPEERQRLREADRAWITYRDRECDFEGFEMRGGSGEALLVAGCLVTKTRERIRDLQRLLPDP